MNEAAEFWGKVAVSGVPGACWLWKGAQAGRVGEKYGQVKWRRRGQVYAHRVAYEIANDSLIPLGLVIDHLCRTHLCVNPDHLRLVTSRENTLAGVNSPARYAARTECSHGHSLADAYRRGANGRRCRTCEHDKYVRRRARSAA